ncbi:spore coat protein JB [Hydrogenispora ethanolica]|jgi:spore coat protein JB|uniref:Spore coat protein JB n=1 Tax=Hydrogenispora ethanolica TaxID=1082276 RepID=A0A4R1RGA6_HYDET|nr:spore coat protein CotJB [Hydrogenispora ethanolica]TCL64730.1 spore coat protein JB [Hydrogenispora ethanolica]
MRPEQLEMLKNLQALEFAALEFGLYLDTHPADQRALNEFSRLAQEAEQCLRTYEAYYGPLSMEASTDNQGCWQWLEHPWPWEIEY